MLNVAFDPDTGRLSGLEDADGNPAVFDYLLDIGNGRTVEVIKDANQVPTELVRDSANNVIRRVQRLSEGVTAADNTYQVTVFQYDGEDRQTHASVPFEVVGASQRFDFEPNPIVWSTESKYDDDGNLEYRKNALGHTTYYDDYDEFGNPGLITDPLNNTTKNTFVDGRLTETTDAQGNVTKFGYDPNGNVNQVTQVNEEGPNVVTHMLLDAAGRVLQSTSPDSQIRYFRYDERGNQTVSYQHWTNPADPSDQWTLATRSDYDEEDRVTGSSQYRIPGLQHYSSSSALPASYQEWATTTEYNDAGRTKKTTDRFERITYSLYNKQGNVVETRTQSADETGAPVWIANRSYYDSNGRTIATTSGLIITRTGGVTDDPTNELFDPIFDSIITQDVRISYTKYDALGRVEETQQLAGIDLGLEKVDPGADESFSEPIYRTTFTAPLPAELPAAILSRSVTKFDDQGRVHKATEYDTSNTSDPVNTELTTTYYKYDNAGRQTDIYQVFDVNENGNSSDFTLVGNFPDPSGADVIHRQTSYDDNGRQLTSTDAKGVITKFEYDKLGRLKKTTADLGGLNIITESKYDSLGRIEAEIGPYSLSNPPDGISEVTKGYTYDVAGRIETVSLPSVSDSLGVLGTIEGSGTYVYNYDDPGNQTLVRDPMHGNPHSKETTFTYDEKNRQLSRTLPDGLLERMFYDDTPLSSLGSLAASVGLGQLAYSVDFEGRVTEYLYDNTATGGGRLVQRIDHGKSTLTGLAQDTSISEFRATIFTPSASPRMVSYKYDELGRRIETNDSQFGPAVTRHTYDADGKLTQIDSPQGFLNYDYDRLGRLTRTWTSTADDGQFAITDTGYTYDQLGRLKTVTVAERFGQTTYAQTPNEQTTYSYDISGNLDEVQLPNGVISDYVYDDLNRLDDLIHYRENGGGVGYQDGTDELVARYDYRVRADGKRERVVETDDLGNTTTIDWTYDELGRLIEERYDFDDPTNSALDNTYDYISRYGFDLASNRVRVEKDNGNSATASFNPDEIIDYAYDQNDRLKAETKEDLSGSNHRHIVYSYDGTTQETKTEYLGLDDQGTVDKVTTFTYDKRGRLQKVEVDEGGTSPIESTTTYQYNDDGIRVSQTNVDSGVTTIYHVDPNSHTGYAQVLEEGEDSATGDGRLQATEIDRAYAIGHDLLSQADANSGPIYYFLYDGHGSTRGLLDDIVFQERYGYDAYGNMLPGASLAETTNLTRFLYSGEQTDGIGLQYLRARYYDSSNGRFNRLDPFAGNFGDPQSLHKYLYVHADPIANIDPTGLFSLIGLGAANSIGATLNGLTGEAGTAALDAAQSIVEGNTLRQTTTTLLFGLFGGLAFGAIFDLVGSAAGRVANQIADFAEDSRRAILQLIEERKPAFFFGALDEFNRSTGARAVITKKSLGTGSRATAEVAGAGGPLSRGHLIPRQLGGPGDRSTNLAPQFQQNVNNSAVLLIENEIKRRVRDVGEVIDLSVIPIYKGADPVPLGFTYRASGSRGFSLEETVRNVPNLGPAEPRF